MRTRKLLSVLAISMILLGACATPTALPAETPAPNPAPLPPPTPKPSPAPSLPTNVEEVELKHDDGTNEGDLVSQTVC